MGTFKYLYKCALIAYINLFHSLLILNYVYCAKKLEKKGLLIPIDVYRILRRYFDGLYATYGKVSIRVQNLWFEEFGVSF
jgi:hypothetical protein